MHIEPLCPEGVWWCQGDVCCIRRSRMVCLCGVDQLEKSDWNAGHGLKTRPEEPSSLTTGVQVAPEGPLTPWAVPVSWSLLVYKGPAECETG